METALTTTPKAAITSDTLTRHLKTWQESQREVMTNPRSIQRLAKAEVARNPNLCLVPFRNLEGAAKHFAGDCWLVCLQTIQARVKPKVGMDADELHQASRSLLNEFPETCSAYLPTFAEAVAMAKYGDFYENFTVLRVAEKYREFLSDLKTAYRREKEEQETKEREEEIKDWEIRLDDPEFKARQQAAMRKCLDENPYVQAALAEELRIQNLPKDMPAVNRAEHFAKARTEKRTKFEASLAIMPLETCQILAENLTLAFKQLDADTEAWALGLLEQRITELSLTQTT